MSLLSVQYPFSCTPSVSAGIEATLTPERLTRYLRKEPQADLHRALRLYLWNIQLCQAVHCPLHFAEVAARNGIQKAMESHFKRSDWYELGSFKAQLSETIKNELEYAVDKSRKEHGSKLTANHVVAGLSFGFWSHLMTRNFERCGVWPKQFRLAFPHKNPGLQRDRVLYRLELIRDFRNRVAHYMAIFDQDIQQTYSTMLELIGWCSPHALWLAESLSQVEAVLSNRPQV